MPLFYDILPTNLSNVMNLNNTTFTICLFVEALGSKTLKGDLTDLPEIKGKNQDQHTKKNVKKYKQSSRGKNVVLVFL